jgi:hypothetical protein
VATELDEDQGTHEDVGTDDFQDIIDHSIGADEEKAMEARAKAPAETDEHAALDGGFYTGGKDDKKGALAKAKKKKKILLVGGGGFGIFFLAGFILIMIIAGSLKTVHFSEILSATGYARLNSIFQQRTSQAVIENAFGEGISAVDSSVLSNIKGTNVNSDLAALGNDGKLAFVKDAEGNFNGIKVNGGEPISLDTIAQRSGAADFKSLGIRERAGVRAQFVREAGASIDQNLELQSRYVRSASFDLVAENIGFSWSRWKQAARDFLGKAPPEANTDNLVNTLEEMGFRKPEPVGIEPVDGAVNELNDITKIRSMLGNKDLMTLGQFDLEKATKLAIADNTNSAANDFLKIGSKVGAATQLIAVACITDVAFSRIDEIGKANTQKAENEGLQLLSAGSQVKAGDTTGEAVSAEARRLDGADLSPAYQAQIGNPNATPPQGFTAPKITPLATGLVKTFIDNVNSLSSVTHITDACKLFLQPGTVVAATVAEIVAQAVAATFTGGGSETGEIAIEGASDSFISNLGSSIFSTAQGLKDPHALALLAGTTVYSLGLEYLITMLATQQFSGLESGANYYERASIGIDAQQNHDMRVSTYGRPLTSQEVAVVDASAQKNVRDNFSQGGIFAKYFSTSNPFSITSSFIASSPTTPSSLISRFQSFVGGLGSLFSPGSWLKPAGTFQRSASATPYDPHYGTMQWGYSNTELNKIENDPTYSIGQNAKIISGRVDELDKKYGKCFSSSTDQYSADQLAEHDGDCSSSSLSQDEVFRYRLYKGLDATTVNILAQDLAHPSASTSPSGGPPTINSSLPSGTAADLISQINATGNVALESGISLDGLKTTTLGVLLRLAQKYKLSVSSTVRPGCGCPHGNGSAADIDAIGAVHPSYGSWDQNLQDYENDVATLLPSGGWMGFPNQDYKTKTLLIASPRGITGDLDPGTGPHFHFNVPASAP